MLALIAVLLMGPTPFAQDPPRMIEGTARIVGTDRPAAGVKLHIFDQADPAYTVETDDQGRFRVPSHPNHRPAPGPQKIHECWAEAEGNGRWTLEAIQQGRFNQPPKSLWASVNSALAKPVEATWQGGMVRVECPEPGEVDVLVRGPDGEPLADRPVQVMPAWQPGEMNHGPADARFTGKLDANGRFRLRWFASTRSYRVIVPGVGFGSTGSIEIKDGATTRAEVPPLAKYGSIAGKLDPKLASPDALVHLATFASHINPEPIAPTACDADGQFAFQDVPPGHYYVQARNQGNAPVGIAAQVTLWLAPGQKLEGVSIGPMPEPPPEVAARQKAQEKKTLEQLNGKKGEVLWAEGVVRDMAGRPLPKADVYLRTAHHGGIRMYEDVLATTTDDQGHYEFRGEVHPTTESPVLVAKVPGRPPAVANAEARSVENDRPARVDLTVADSGGSASVTVLRDGKPLPDAKVYLEATGSAAILAGFGWAREAGGPSKEAFQALVSPGATTDRDGVARFAELVQGLYIVHAAENAPGNNRPPRALLLGRNGVGTGKVEGVAIVAGQETRATVPIVAAAAGHAVPFQVIRPDGRPVANEEVSFEFGLGGSTNRSTSMKVDAQGIGRRAFESTGLWSVVVRFRDVPVRSFPIPEPYYEAEALVPVSPAVPITEPIRLVGVLHPAGSIRVRLLDADGRPARGMVELPSPFDRNGPSISADANGEVLLEGLASRKYQVHGSIEAPGPPPMSLGEAIPDDDSLRGPFVVVPGAEATVTSGRETLLELKARRVGYIRGKLQPTEGQAAADYTVHPFFDQRILMPGWRYDPATGEFFGGPFLAGPVTLRFQRWMPDGTTRNSGRQVVEVAEGQVVHVDLKPGEIEPEDNARRNRSTMLGMGGIATNEGIPAIEPPTVFLPDGKTPAFAAQASLFEPGHDGPTAIGRSDGSGRLTWRGAWTSGNPGERDRAGDVAKPTLVVSLPGRYGPTVVPVEEIQAGRIVLADSAAFEGLVNAAGKGAEGGSGVRVMAAHQGGGVLDGALSQQISPGPDGRFRFEGLAPGRYRVQAIRDGIWVSRSVEVQLEANRAPAPIVLEIPAPGEPLTLLFADPGGNPYAHQAVTLARPEGPFASTWPANLRTDGSGRIRFLSLEAGPHSATVEGAEGRATFTAFEASNKPASPIAELITLRRTVP
ncbi:MAG: hypothetical protein U0800_26855 [Isosphaeraceae bacterium]